jgi:hypothetical protein
MYEVEGNVSYFCINFERQGVLQTYAATHTNDNVVLS